MPSETVEAMIDPPPAPASSRGLPAWLLCLLLTGGMLSGCSSAAQVRLGSADASRLSAQLAGASAAAGRGDRAGTLSELRGFQARIGHLAVAGSIAPADARALKLGAAQALAAAERQLKASSTATAAPATSASPAPASPDAPLATLTPERPDHRREQHRRHGPHGRLKGAGKRESQ
jgi:outer membrane murein-binding lipoprotein Lpp